MIARMVASLSYAALGSSFASGPGIEPVVDRHAMRSGDNYPHRLARLLDADLTDLSVSGATTATILDQPQATIWGTEFPPQLDGVPERADLVTVTAGGNDLRYMGALLFTAWNHLQPGGPMARLMGADLPDGVPRPGDEDIERTADGLTRIVSRVRARAPRSRVLLVDYLTILADDVTPRPGIPFSAAEFEEFRLIRAALETAYELAAQRSGAELVAVSRISRDHALGSAEPWILPFSADPTGAAGSFHPNAEGMAAVADEIARHVTGQG
ncbi:SGNH/GDSL hydrolase family protein [Actinoplanes couchii]|uniref:Hydrolase n=1 Tax=Actinoplanes couchii TaxID=403638 RepID=A0ABQ3XEZ0_9ACTN|nr:SGNH/GDSL hydrolase family protein [Actinoplanes couchii]MDR6319935.1 lysophospholipase L1-like esterase [Actinoplanes couchii]GID57071.1 hydrolase [Actinoplanes couchii]